MSTPARIGVREPDGSVTSIYLHNVDPGEETILVLDYGDEAEYQAVFIFELRDGKIARETAYWSLPFEAPEWREQWVERI